MTKVTDESFDENLFGRVLPKPNMGYSDMPFVSIVNTFIGKQAFVGLNEFVTTRQSTFSPPVDVRQRSSPESEKSMLSNIETSGVKKDVNIFFIEYMSCVVLNERSRLPHLKGDRINFRKARKLKIRKKSRSYEI